MITVSRLVALKIYAQHVLDNLTLYQCIWRLSDCWVIDSIKLKNQTCQNDEMKRW